ncbi:hypothetical protein ACQKFL_11515 [Vreelandella titanicae]|uniref:hypothetical protein n=1 Tax=Vreelandella titanicae TaxID=664683 RepID=UPI003D072C18
MKIQHSAFRGELPILDARLLPENNAQQARNVFLKRGTLKPERAPLAVESLGTVANPSTLYRYPSGNDGEGFWLTWGLGKNVHVVKSPLANDDFSRVYWTGDGFPKMGGISDITSGTPPYPGSSYRLGIPAPSSGPTASPPEGRAPVGERPPTVLETSYVVTLISNFGEEGAPSTPSNIIERWDMVGGAPSGGQVDLLLPGIPSGSFDIVAKRIYRAESGGIYQYVAQVSASASEYTDNITSAQLGRALPSVEWDMPDARLKGLTALPGGILAGFFDNTLCFSEAYLPHAWPVAYQLAFKDNIVAIGATSSGLIVATQGQPYLVSGSSPEAMSPMQLDVDQPCVAARSLADMGEYVIYAGHEGLVAAGGRDARVVTAEVFTKDQWQALNPSTIHAYRYDGRYLAFYNGGCMVFTPGEGVEFLDINASGGYYDIAAGTLYIIQNNVIKAWGEGQLMTFTWRSRLHEVPPGGAGFTCGKLIASQYPARLIIRADENTVLDSEIASPSMFRLPAGYTLCRDWEIEIQGTNEVQSIQIATSPSELI